MLQSALVQAINFLKDLPRPIKKLTLAFSLLYFLYYFNFFWLIQNVFILDHGINFTQLSVILAAWSLSILILEIPSGILADRLGRKPVIVLAKLAFLLGIAIFAIYPSFLGFLIGVIAFGLHDAFTSGAQEALLYDNLKDFGQEKIFGKILALITTLREVGLGTGVLLAGFITQISVNYNLMGSIIIALFGFSVSFGLIESKTHSLAGETKLWRQFRGSISLIKGNPYLLRIVVFSLTTVTAYVIISEYFVPSLKSLQASFAFIGILAAIEAGFFSLGSVLSQRLIRPDNGKIYIALSILMTAFLLVISLGTIPTVIIGFLILRTVKAIGEIVTLADWQQYVPSDKRATTISMNSFIRNLVYVVFGITFGKLADQFGLFKGFYLVAALAFSYLIFSLLFPRDTKPLRSGKIQT